MLDQDRRKRDDWLRRMKASKTGSQIMVGEDITLADVVKWLVEAVEAK